MNRSWLWPAALSVAVMQAMAQEALQHSNPASAKWRDPKVLWQEEKRVAKWLHIDLGSGPFAADLTNQQWINQSTSLRIVLSCTKTAQFAQDIDYALHACEWSQIRSPQDAKTPPPD